MSAGEQSGEAAQERLMQRVSAMRTRTASDVVDRAGDPTDFATLPGFAELRVQNAAAEWLGLENPYFKVHDGRAGAHTVIDGRRLLNFSCYDYLGLNNDAAVIDAARVAIDRYGVSASASRVVAGERQVHRELEDTLARHYGCDGALVFVSGYATNLGVIGQLVGPKDLVIYDIASHNSVIMGGVLSGATRRSFLHNDLDSLDAIMTASRDKYHRVLIVAEGLYSMDGDVPDLPRLIEIKRKHKAWLMIDEAHALGVLGRRGFGVAEHFNADPRDVDIWMGTLSKTLAACGGYIAGSAALIEYLRSLCHAFVYSVAMPPVVAAAALKSLEILHNEPQRVEQLQRNNLFFFDGARRRGADTGSACGTAVCPIVVGDSIAAALLAQRMFLRGINVQPVLYPAVPARTSRLRFFITSMHTQDELTRALDALAEELAMLPDGLRALNLPGQAVEV